jgi:glycosyltransferase involved in cell wall biosynthesis
VKATRRSYSFGSSNTKKKNVLGLLRAFSKIYTAVPHRLRLVGPRREQLLEGETGATLRSLPRERVEILDYLRDDESLRAMYRMASLFVFPSFHEAFGLTVIEAMAAGVPDVTSDLPALREVAGDAALYCNPHDSENIAETMIERLQMRESLIDCGRAQARQFTWERSTAALELVFNSVLAERK